LLLAAEVEDKKLLKEERFITSSYSELPKRVGLLWGSKENI
jgi:hypothetical protein